ncbi:VanW family protein [Aquipuribacter hungaricus]|uniref:VanW family protein n=1 Tax=Aquipuribacter hungaricus TaxID=545624 RepID=A0ABV7WBD1_9MICO
MSTSTTSRPETVGSAGGRGWVGPLLALLAVAVVVVGVYVGAAYALADRVPFGTSAAGVDIGGRSADDAVALLEAEVAPRAEDPVEVSVGEDVDSLDPAAAGLGVDLASTVGSVTGFSLEPARMWRHVVGAGDLSVATDVDEPALEAALAEVAGRLGVEPVDGDVTFPGGVPTRVEPVEGREVDVAGAAAAVRAMWLATDGPVPLPADTRAVQVGQEDVDAGMELAQAAVAAPLVVVVGDREVGLAPEQFGPTLAMDPGEGGTLGLAVDGDALRAATLAVDPALEQAPADARIELAGGAPTVVPGALGRSLPAGPLSQASVAALQPGTDRRAVVEGAVVEPELTTEEAQALGVKEVVSTFSTNYPDNPDRTNNLAVASRTIDGTLVLPGEEFSLNDALGERTTAKGYRAAGVISNGILSEGVGGGVSQVATTTYNAAFFAGLEITAFKPHSLYIPRYPAGRESTLNYSPRVDMAFRNDTSTAILIQAGVGGGQITVTFWGTKTWDVEAVSSGRYSATSGTTVYDPSSDCRGQSPIDGFTIDTTRIWRQGGAEVKRETETWRYIPADRIICGPRPAA